MKYLLKKVTQVIPHTGLDVGHHQIHISWVIICRSLSSFRRCPCTEALHENTGSNHVLSAELFTHDWYFLFVISWPNIDMWPCSSFLANCEVAKSHCLYVEMPFVVGRTWRRVKFRKAWSSFASAKEVKPILTFELLGNSGCTLKIIYCVVPGSPCLGKTDPVWSVFINLSGLSFKP